MCEENVDKSPAAVGALLALLLFLSCANTRKYQQPQKQETDKIAPKIENRQKIATNQFLKVSRSYYPITR